MAPFNPLSVVLGTMGVQPQPKEQRNPLFSVPSTQAGFAKAPVCVRRVVEQATPRCGRTNKLVVVA